MSSSDEDSKIDLLDSPATVKKKLKKTFCEPGNVDNNGLLSFVKHVVFALFDKEEAFTIKRKAENGGDINFYRYEDLEQEFGKKLLHPGDLKQALEYYINKLLKPIIDSFSTPELRKLSNEAYPQTNVIQKVTSLESKDGPGKLDLRVGKIVTAVKHPGADMLYILEVDVGEECLRTIVSGLAEFVSIEKLCGRLIAVLCNLKPAKLKGVESNGLVLCASNIENSEVEPVLVPLKCIPGEKLYFQGHVRAPDGQLNSKKKAWERIQKDLKTNSKGEIVWNEFPLLSASDENIRSNLRDCAIK